MVLITEFQENLKKKKIYKVLYLIQILIQSGFQFYGDSISGN